MLFRGYDQEGLNAQYNNRKRFPGYLQDFEAWGKRSAETRERRRAMLDVAYGDGPLASLDIFPADDPAAPLCVFIHGGYWYSLDKKEFSYVADGMVPNGVATAVINYPLAPDHDMDDIVRHNRAAVAWLWRNARDYGADPERIYACGHSAGGHLVTMMLATDWPAFDAGLPAAVVKGACAISGLFDLEPIRLSYLNETLGMSEAMAARNSPLRQSYPVAAPLLVVLGGDESEEYHRQSREMDALWRGLGYPSELVIPPGLDHFSIVDSLGDPSGDLVRRQFAHMP